ncbi:MAG: NAD-dependent epimerase/dehydratase family protein [Acutalibacteraceae bacterium]
MKKTTVALTGASGNMGFQGFLELYARKYRHNIVLLLRNSEKNRKKFMPYMNDPAVKIVWGDLTNYEDVLQMVNGADYVLHVGGMVSPAADYYPRKTIKTNVAAAENIVRAVKAQPDPDAVKVVYIGTVAETGDRNPPIHWARTGDPIKISVYDHYAISKVKAEAVFAESGLRYWVSLRQSGILYPAILKNMDPIMFHVPINGVLEWATVEDSGRLLANVCEPDVPDSFWRKFYNIGSGKEYRITNYEFEEYLLGALGLPSPKKLFEASWFILRNFHGQWYADSDKLEEILHFRANIPIKKYFADMAKNVPAYYRACKVLPSFLSSAVGAVAKPFMKKIAQTELYGTLHWKATHNKDRISAYYGTEEDWNKIGTWDDVKIERPTETVTLLDHGYDESKPDSELDIEDMRKAAAFRGGECLSETMVKGDLFTPLKWKSARGNEFEMSPNLVLKGGHWCPEELPWPWDYDTEAKINPFFAQVWYPLHSKDENNFYDETIFKGFKDY